MEKYDGSSDPVDHHRSFVDLMRLQATPDVIMCRAFPPTLRREARDSVATLLQNRSDKDELLKDFIARFNRATLGNQRSTNVCCSHCHDEWNSKSSFQDVTLLKSTEYYV
ncbi:RNase H domain-containing protein [Abeliophyllum distichum]|uniref:RNase H domain-containing protein n=1 Tax=Abeliophyllum distichum TaxID=126358 RepID=A0ABD1NSF2_9LAMI